MENCIKVVAAVISNSEGRMLITRRAPDKIFPGEWEFPGGKVEEGESAEDALLREIQEELGVAVSIGDRMLEWEHEYKDRWKVCLSAYSCAWNGGTLALAAHDAYDWVLSEDFDNYKFVDGERELLAVLKNEKETA